MYIFILHAYLTCMFSCMGIQYPASANLIGAQVSELHVCCRWDDSLSANMLTNPHIACQHAQLCMASFRSAAMRRDVQLQGSIEQHLAWAANADDYGCQFWGSLSNLSLKDSEAHSFVAKGQKRQKLWSVCRDDALGHRSQIWGNGVREVGCWIFDVLVLLFYSHQHLS